VAPPLSVYRGQGTTGIGEGPGNPISHGEQYLDADRPLCDDAALLAAIRPWMTLDAKGSDHLALGEQIEGWSYFAHGGLRFVARLGHAPQFVASDRRAAYFTHARAWSADVFGGSDEGEGVDPGAHLGRTEAFDGPWPPGGRSARVPVPEPHLVRFAQVVAEAQVAERLLAHLYQAIVQGYPVIMAVPLAEFVTGGPLHALVSFARAALPLALKRDCRIRVFTTTPHQFVKQLGAHLVVIPDVVAAEALQARRDATLLDRTGQRREGRDAGPEALAYAQMAVQRTRKLDYALLPFTDRVGRVLPHIASALPTDRDLAVARVVFNVVGAIRSNEPEKDLGDLLTRHLVKSAADTGTALPKIFRVGELLRIPDQKLVEVLYGMPDLAQSDGGRALLGLVDTAARCRDRSFDADLEGAFTGELADWQLERLSWLLRTVRPSEAPLVADAPRFREAPLISPARAVAWTQRVPLARVAAKMNVALVLREELAAGVLGRRSSEQAEMARLCTAPEVLAVLIEAVDGGVLGVEWAMMQVQSGAPEEIGPLAAAVLAVWLRTERWIPVFDALLGRLLDQPGRRVAPTLAEPLVVAARHAKVPGALARHLDLLELAARAGATDVSMLVTDLWRALESVQQPLDRRLLVSKVLSGAAWSRRWETLVTDRGKLTLPESWEPDVAELILSSSEGIAALSLSTLLRLASPLAAGHAALTAVAAKVDSEMTSRRIETTAALVRADWWLAWRSRTSLGTQPVRDAAMGWLTCELWQKGWQGATIEAWHRAMEDLGTLSFQDVNTLTSGSPRNVRWPWIPPFRDEQLSDLASAAADLGVLVRLAQVIDAARDLGYLPPRPLLRALLDGSRFRDLPWEAVEWLSRAAASEQTVPPPPLPASVVRSISAASGHVSRVLQAFAAQPPQDFVEEIETWARDTGAVQRNGLFGKLVDGWLAAMPAVGTSRPDAALAAQLDRLGLPRLASFFAGKRDLYPRAFAALSRAAGSADPCWNEIANALPTQPGMPHPIGGLVSFINGRWKSLTRDERHAVDEHGFDNFTRVVQRHVGLADRTPVAEGQPEAPLPAMQLARILLRKAAPGMAAIKVVTDWTGTTELVESPAWWDALFIALDAVGRHHVDHRTSTVIKRIQNATHLVPSRKAKNALRVVAEEWLLREDQRTSGRGAYVSPTKTDR